MKNVVLVAVAVLVAGSAGAQDAPQRMGAWDVMTFEDEFDGTESKLAFQDSSDGDLSMVVSCPVANALMFVQLRPGPAADWRVFDDGAVDLRLDETLLASITLDDENTHLIGIVDIRDWTAGSVLTVRVSVFRAGYEVGSFDMSGLRSVLGALACAQ